MMVEEVSMFSYGFVKIRDELTGFDGKLDELDKL